jgi:DNA mismatch endonuclease (patch repair protein)
MSRVRGRDTKPEMLIRRGLHARGFRYRLHVRELPGRPDLVFPAHHAVIFVHGCFWHGHECPLFHLPATRAEFWATKIAGNRQRDALAEAALESTGWRRLTVWECALRGRARWQDDGALDACAAFLRGHAATAQLSGRWDVVP